MGEASREQLYARFPFPVSRFRLEYVGRSRNPRRHEKALKFDLAFNQKRKMETICNVRLMFSSQHMTQLG